MKKYAVIENDKVMGVVKTDGAAPAGAVEVADSVHVGFDVAQGAEPNENVYTPPVES